VTWTAPDCFTSAEPGLLIRGWAGSHAGSHRDGQHWKTPNAHAYIAPARPSERTDLNPSVYLMGAYGSEGRADEPRASA
jgi:hypothetical protein